MIISEMQRAIILAGWQFLEHVFNDGMTQNCFLEFTQDKSPHALSTYPRPKDCLGWGRFDRQFAWEQAYDRIVNKGEPLPCP